MQASERHEKQRGLEIENLRRVYLEGMTSGEGNDVEPAAFLRELKADKEAGRRCRHDREKAVSSDRLSRSSGVEPHQGSRTTVARYGRNPASVSVTM